MRSIHSIILSLSAYTLTLTLVSDVPAQTPAFPQRSFQHEAKISLAYEDVEGIGTTFISLEPMYVDRSETDKTSLRLGANVEYEGRSPARPKHIMLSFHASYPDCRFSRPQVMLYADGEQIEIGFSSKGWRDRQPDEEGVAFRFNDMKSGRCLDSLAMFISQKNFLKVVNAREVRVKVGEFAFQLNESILEALRDLASRMLI